VRTEVAAFEAIGVALQREDLGVVNDCSTIANLDGVIAEDLGRSRQGLVATRAMAPRGSS
jgi:hypothetical protein